MQKLCGRVAELLRQHPILWLPYTAADLLAICLWRLRGLAEKGIFHWFTTGHSVLGGDIALPRYDSATLAKASIAYIPIGVTTIVAVVCLFVAALVATTDIVDAFEREQRPDAREILAGLAAQWRRILLFALRFLVTVGVLVGGTAALSFYLLSLAHRQDLLTSFVLLAVGMLIGVGCTAWLVMPATIRLLRGGGTVMVSAHARNQGTILAIIAAEAGAALGFFVPKLEGSMVLNSRWEITALSVFNSVVADAPDALLFIALALLAAEFLREDVGKEGSKTLEVLPLLMPLHFGKAEEPPQVEGGPNQ
jgi:hypothetical protein